MTLQEPYNKARLQFHVRSHRKTTMAAAGAHCRLLGEMWKRAGCVQPKRRPRWALLSPFYDSHITLQYIANEGQLFPPTAIDSRSICRCR